jgi:transposase
MSKRIRFIGMDVHKNSISIAIAEEGRTGEVRNYGKIVNKTTALDKVIRKLISDNCELSFVYEAGPCGYELYRHLIGKGFSCEVVAPSMIPKKSGDRIKNDRRDAQMLARLYRAGELSSVYVPYIEDEAMRDLTRAREDAKHCERKAKQRLNAFLLRHGFMYSGKSKWSKAHFCWISDIKMTHPAQQITLEEYVLTLGECSQRVERLTQQIRELLPSWRLFSVVEALQTLRGVSLIIAATTVAELGDLKRFETPSCLMAYLGLVPSEHSSGESTKRGGITKTGNGHVRRLLVEAAWAYRFPARKSRCLLNRQKGLPSSICDISWKAQLRLCSRYRRMVAKNKTRQVVVTAIARELSAFMWAIVQEIPLGE